MNWGEYSRRHSTHKWVLVRDPANNTKKWFNTPLVEGENALDFQKKISNRLYGEFVAAMSV